MCDANISRVVTGPDSVPLDVGRTARNPSKALRRAVVIRDQHCRYPGCDRRPNWCQTHHIIPWLPHGETRLDNLALLCDYHHHTIHKPGRHATLDGHTLTVTKPQGRVIGSTTR